MKRVLLTSSLIMLLSFVYAQRKNINSLSRIMSHIEYLASDSLEGRRTGTRGEALAAQYIEDQFKQRSLQFYPGLSSYLQPFDFPDGHMVSDRSNFIINGSKFSYGKDYYALSFSAHQFNSIEEVYPSLKEPSHTWTIDITDVLEKTAQNPHGDLINELRIISQNLASKGASGILFYSTGQKQYFPEIPKKFSETLGIPVFMMSTNDQILTSVNQTTPLKLIINFQLEKKLRKASNVIGFLNNHQKETVVIGAHFDHLGYGEDGNSMLRNVVNQIHNGADDNASGTSTMLELASMLKQKKYRHYNYIFIAFSAEELGLLGSRYFTDHHDQKKIPIKYMINLDMVGRLNDTSKTLTIGGYGTTKDWSAIFSKSNKTDLKFKFDSSGTGPSDHTSFYRKDIPVLFYFTGLHTDYHKPTDDAGLINVNGIKLIIDHIGFIVSASKDYALPFSKTREQQSTTNTRFSVSLGIMPDYSFSGTGVRVDGVSEGKIAQQVGIQPSDILIKLGDVEITSVESYMKALSKFKKGDTTVVQYQRGAQNLQSQITFK